MSRSSGKALVNTTRAFLHEYQKVGGERVHYVYCFIGIVISFIWSLISSILSIIPVSLVGGVYLLKLYSGGTTLDSVWLYAGILVICYVTLTELGCWVLELLNNTLISGYLSKIVYRFVTTIGVGIILCVMYIIQHVLGGF